MTVRGVSKGWLSLIFILSILSLILLVPTFAGDSLPSWWGKFFPKRGIRLGLDLKGGVFLELGVRTDKAVDHELSNIKNVISEELAKQKGLIKSVEKENNILVLDFFSKEDLLKAKQIVQDNFGEIANINVKGLSLVISLSDQYIRELKKNAISQVKQVIENRVLDFGLVEPSIQRAGDDRIIVQVPGASQQDRQRIVDLIKKSAVLEFKIVRDTAPDKETLLGEYGVKSEQELLDKGLIIHPGNTGNENERYFLTDAEAAVTGEYISDARIIFDQFGKPAVGFKFRGEGAKKFAELTGANIGKRLAIVLDGHVQSAPVIRDRISFKGTITGDFTTQEAKDLALVLRSGSLPVPVDVQQERTVGPSLGKDSIEKGTISIVIGGILVMVLMVIIYRFQGIIADMALMLNMLFILGFLSAFGVTLTLPGIAGLVLTMGMAVDGNIIIFERIKEELRSKKLVVAAIDAGYSKSVWTILDANITTLLTALILFWFGTGPIKGFAATLTVGIISTVFSNLVVARIMTNMFYRGSKVKHISI